MIIVKIQGGLGNQLFEYAYGRAISERYKVPLKLDLTNYDFANAHDESPDKKFNRGYGISRFNTIGEIATKNEIQIFNKYKRRPGKIWYLYNKFIADPALYLEESQFNYSEKCAFPDALKKGKSVYADGFWQTEKYFKDIEQIIRRELTLRHAPDTRHEQMISLMKDTESICLHVRRGNFLIPQYNKHHGICPPDYYERAVKAITKKIKKPHFFIFSDDMTWVKENLSLDFPTTYVDINGPEKDYEDIRLMSSCKHHILANSSFSWWGAWLSNNKSQIVFYPSKIVRKNWNMQDFAPKKWNRIDIELI